MVPRDGSVAVDNIRHSTTVGNQHRLSCHPVRRLGTTDRGTPVPARAVIVSIETRTKSCVNNREWKARKKERNKENISKASGSLLFISLLVYVTGPRITVYQLLDIFGFLSIGTAARTLYPLLWSEVWEISTVGMKFIWFFTPHWNIISSTLSYKGAVNYSYDCLPCSPLCFPFQLQFGVKQVFWRAGSPATDLEAESWIFRVQTLLALCGIVVSRTIGV